MADNKIDALSIIKGFISKAYKMDDGKIAEIFDAENATNESIAAALLAEDTQRVSLLKKQNADNKDSFNQGYAKATKEQRAAFEKEIKEAFELESDTTGIDLINEIITAKAPAGGKGAAEITDDDVKKHTVYQTMERNFKKQLKEATDANAAKVEELEKGYKRNETFYGVREKADAFLAALKPILPNSANVATTIKNQFFNELKGYDYEQQADGSFIVTKDGKVLEDAHGHTKSFEDVVKGLASNYFEFEANNGGANAGNENKGAQGGAGAARTFKTQKEALDYANDTSVPLADRMAALEAYNKSGAAE